MMSHAMPLAVHPIHRYFVSYNLPILPYGMPQFFKYACHPIQGILPKIARFHKPAYKKMAS